LYAIGDLEEGIASYRSISPSSTRFFEDGWFKVGKALKLQKEFGSMREHFGKFVSGYPESRRMAEAVYWIGWAHKADGDEAGARDIYWDAVEAHGGRAELFGIADLFDGLRKLYPGDTRAEYRSRLRSLAERARADDDADLELHARWAAGKSWAPESADYRVSFTRACELCDPENHNPRILADCGDYLMRKGDPDGADALFEGLRKWHPRAFERDRAFLGRARIAKEKGRSDLALELLRRFEEETPYSPRLADAKLLRAELLAAGGKADEGLEVLSSLLEDKSLPSAAKAEALFRSAEILAGKGDKLKATAYFERVYVAYGKYRELVAKSYLRRGELLVGLGKREQAIEVYRELAEREDLAGFAERAEARKRLKEMGEVEDA
jgi:TolA-binding protein